MGSIRRFVGMDQADDQFQKTEGSYFTAKNSEISRGLPKLPNQICTRSHRCSIIFQARGHDEFTRSAQCFSIGIMESSIPILSLSEAEEVIATQLRSACIDHGFLFVKDHGVDAALIESVFAESKALFALSLEEKRSMSDPELSRGFTAMQEETLDPANQSEVSSSLAISIARSSKPLFQRIENNPDDGV